MRTIPELQEGTHRAKASGTLPNGKPVVVNSDGTVSVVSETDVSQSVGTPVVYESAGTAYTSSVYDSNSNKVVISYRDAGNSYYGTAIVGTVSGSSISFGTPTVFESAQTDRITSTFDSNENKVVVAYSDSGNSRRGTAVVGTVSGTSISFGSPVIFDTSDTREISSTFDTSANKVVLAYRDLGNSNYGTAIVGTVSGTSISFGSPAIFESAYTTRTSSVFDTNSNKVVIAYSDVANSNYGTAIVGTVSGTSISFGSATVFETANTLYISAVYEPSAQKVVIAYEDNGNSNYGTAIVGAVSGTSISFGTAVVFEAARTEEISIGLNTSTNTVVISYADFGNLEYGTVITGTVSGNSISFGDPLVYESNEVIYTSVAFDSSSGKIVLSYVDDTNLDYGHAAVFQNAYTSTNLTSENYIGMSSGAVEIIPSETGTAVTYDASETAYQDATFDSTNNKVVIGYRDYGNSSYGTAVVGTVSGTSITYGTPVVFETGTSNDMKAAYDSNAGKVVFVYQDASNSSYATAVVGTVSGTSISFGTPVVFESSSSENFGVAFDSSNNKIVIARQDNSGPGGDEQRGRAVVGTVSGTSISFGTPTTFLADNVAAVSIEYDTTAQKVVIAFQDTGDSSGRAVVGTVSGTSISFGTSVQFDSNEVSSATATTYDPVNNKVVISYRESTNVVGKSIVGTVSGTSISFGTASNFMTGIPVDITSAYSTETGAVIVTYKDNDDRYTYAVGATVSGTSVSFSDTLTVENSNTTAYVASTYDTNANKSIATYKYNFGSTGEGKAVVFKVGLENRGQVNSGSSGTVDIIGSLSTNQSGLTAGQQYYVQTDGTIGETADDPSVFAGTAISATSLVVKT